MKQITITVPLPARILSPNVTIGSRGGRMAKAAAIKKSRNFAACLFMSEHPQGFKPLWKRASSQTAFGSWRKKGRLCGRPTSGWSARINASRENWRNLGLLGMGRA